MLKEQNLDDISETIGTTPATVPCLPNFATSQLVNDLSASSKSIKKAKREYSHVSIVKK